MKKYGFVLVFIFIFIVAFIFNSNTFKNSVTSVDYSIEGMSLEEKIGQMLFVEYRSSEYTSEFYDAVYKYKPGGFILYSENLKDYNDYFELINKLKSSSDIPIFLGIDQEGGYMQRLRWLGNIRLTKLKSLEELGKEDLKYAYLYGKVSSEELSAFGINVNFSPVLDISTTSDNEFDFSRSFSMDKDEVAEYGKSYILGLNNFNVISCAKHLPGIGDGNEDTHIDSAYILKSREELEKNELFPFKVSSEYLDMMMTSHAIIPSITGDVPLTLSREGIDYLKDYLEYDGLIVSDGLRMRALTNYYSTEEILIGAINAGVDVLLAPEKMSITVEIIKNAVLDGQISEDRINEAVEKILKVKTKLSKREYTLDDFLLTYHKMLLSKDFKENYDLVDNYIFNSKYKNSLD